MTTIDYKELEMALDFVSGGIITSAAAYISRDTGKIFWESSELEEELPQDIESPELYVQVPMKHELDLGKPLALKFAIKHLSDSYRAIEEIFQSRGAYSRFKSFLESNGCLEDWYEFEDASVRAALTEWADSEGFKIK
ncbi:MAG: UPF0158 family protein [Pseudohongiellaceae bacterium]